MLVNPFSDQMIALLERDHADVIMAAKFEFDSGTTRVHTAVGDIVINGETYYGVGALGEVGSVAEENNTSAQSMQATLSGLDVSLIGIALNEECVDKKVDCYLVGVVDGVAQVADLLFRGFITANSVMSGGENAISYTISNIFEDWAYGLPDRYTDESQRALHNGDRFFRYVAQMAERSIYWGSKKDAPGFIYN